MRQLTAAAVFLTAVGMASCGGSGGSSGGGSGDGGGATVTATSAATSTTTATSTAATAAAPTLSALQGTLAQATPCGAVAQQPAAVQAVLSASYVSVGGGHDGLPTQYSANTSDGAEVFIYVSSGKLTGASYLQAGKTTAIIPTCTP